MYSTWNDSIPYKFSWDESLHPRGSDGKFTDGYLTHNERRKDSMYLAKRVKDAATFTANTTPKETVNRIKRTKLLLQSLAKRGEKTKYLEGIKSRLDKWQEMNEKILSLESQKEQITDQKWSIDIDDEDAAEAEFEKLEAREDTLQEAIDKLYDKSEDYRYKVEEAVDNIHNEILGSKIFKDKVYEDEVSQVDITVGNPDDISLNEIDESYAKYREPWERPKKEKKTPPPPTPKQPKKPKDTEASINDGPAERVVSVVEGTDGVFAITDEAPYGGATMTALVHVPTGMVLKHIEHLDRNTTATSKALAIYNLVGDKLNDTDISSLRKIFSDPLVKHELHK